MTKERLSKLYYDALDDIHDACDEMYDWLHPYGSPMTTIPDEYETRIRRFMARVRENLSAVKEAIKEHNNE
jgi:uncharacterized protein Yka (UPF0111/DUF47 family)